MVTAPTLELVCLGFDSRPGYTKPL